MVDVKQINAGLNQYIRPQTFPLAIRMCASEGELPEKVRIPERDLNLNISLCHAITMARRYGWTMAVDKYQSCYGAGISMGFLPLLPDVVDGSYQASLGLWGMTKEQAAAAIANTPKFEYGKYKYALMAPLDRATFEPHLVLVYGNPAQIWLLLSGYLFGTGKSSLDAKLSQGAGCTTYITRAMQTDEAQFAIIGTGERVVPHTQDHECALSIPASKIEKTIQGLELAHKTGAFRYPVPSTLRYNSQHPPGYDKMRSHLLGEET
ncbi:MAG: hypothetical protein FJ008_05225 [Chloroflexi bacterium]|nr:hypothetical protein [Chloroflexota bacterium]MBM3154719.1 hypothetical protein [Chloroflexota bacterium]MBM3173529.1 hypothetical protein [Chloroflexota bacterium]MBM3174558.1 hypothetical protein [Chloroflexota bacterium]MBM4450295.1 hypothetical protein [Chloroflexota bacterium]